MSELVHQRVLEHCKRLRLGAVAARLDNLLDEATRGQMTYLDLLDLAFRTEAESKLDRRVRMGIQIAHFPVIKTLDGFDYSAQPSIDQGLMRELSTGRFVANGHNVLLFGPPGWARPTWPLPWGGP